MFALILLSDAPLVFLRIGRLPKWAPGTKWHVIPVNLALGSRPKYRADIYVELPKAKIGGLPFGVYAGSFGPPSAQRQLGKSSCYASKH